jgi:hypothetical protein
MNEFRSREASGFRSLDKTAWKKYLFYGDMLVWSIFGVATAFMVSNIFVAGWARGELDWGAYSSAWWNSMISLAFMVGSLAWIFFRFWKNGYLAMRRPF